MNSSVDMKLDQKYKLEVRSNQKSVFTSTLSSPQRKLNSDAIPFLPAESIGDHLNQTADLDSYETFTLKVPLNGKIWKSISARSHHDHYILEESDSKERKSTYSIYENDFDRTIFANVLVYGILHVYRKDNVHIEITLEKSIRVIMPDCNILLTVSKNANATSIFHPNGRVIQNNSRVDVVTYDGEKRNDYLRFAKMWYKGISFSTKNCPLIYLLDAAGVRTTVDKFPELTEQCARDIFYNNCSYIGQQYFDEANKMLEKSKYFRKMDGTEILDINQVKITNFSDGTISVQRSNNKCLIRINPETGSVNLTTSLIHCTTSMGSSSHLFVKRGDRRIHFDGSKFCVRNAGHSAGFNNKNQITIFT